MQAVDELELSSFRYGGVRLTGFSLINRDKAASYQRDVMSHGHRLTAGSYSAYKHKFLTVSIDYTT